MNKPCTVYIGIPMTGYDKDQMKRISKHACELAKSYGLNPWSPVEHERIEGQGMLTNSKLDLDWKWNLDKSALNNCFCTVFLRADEKSFGCEDEYGRHRYSEWQPSFRISTKHATGYMSIANYQADGLFGDLDTCFQYIINNFGTINQRRIWKIKLWLKSGPYWLWRQLRRLNQ